MVISCSKCGKEFEVDQYQLDTQQYENLKICAIVCPDCGLKIPYYFEDSTQKRLTGRVAMLKKSINTALRQGKQCQARQRELSRLLWESKSYQKFLRDKHFDSATAALNNAD